MRKFLQTGERKSKAKEAASSSLAEIEVADKSSKLIKIEKNNKSVYNTNLNPAAKTRAQLVVDFCLTQDGIKIKK